MLASININTTRSYCGFDNRGKVYTNMIDESASTGHGKAHSIKF